MVKVCQSFLSAIESFIGDNLHELSSKQSDTLIMLFEILINSPMIYLVECDPIVNP